jgi:hypothetical protein
MSGLWRAFCRGFGNTLGIAQIRRHVETPQESVRAVLAEIREAARNAPTEDVDDSDVIGFGQRESATGSRPPRGWFKAELERARKRSDEVPEWARPKYTG